MTDYPHTLRGNKTKRIFFRWLKIIIIIYLLIGIALFFFQDNFLFQSVALPQDYQYSFNMAFKEINIPFDKNDNLNIVQFFPKDSSPKGVVLYFHGNRININHYAAYAINFTRLGYEVWMPDYPGYGKTTGNITEEKLYAEALQVYQLARTRFSKDSIIIYGKSLGSGIASELASVEGSKRLILETPYYSIPALFSCYAPIYPTSVMSNFNIPTYKYLEKIKVPITIFHGSDDEIIPYYSAAGLKKSLKPQDQFITIEKGRHNNLNDFMLFHQKLDSLLQQH